MINFELNQLSGDKVSEKDIRKWLKKIDKVLRLKRESSMSIAIVGGPAIRKLNKMYRGKDKVTDVLSFSEMDSSINRHFLTPDYLGEVILCYPKIAQQAKKAGCDISKELERLLVHGTMHLLGYDHETESEALVMEALEKKILK